MSVGTICTRTVHTATRSERAQEAARRMKQFKVGSLVVVDLEGTPVGILTDRDIAIKCVANGLGRDARIDEVMTRPVTTVPESMDIEEAIRTMANAHVRRLVVIGPDGKITGLLTLDDVLDLVTEEASNLGQLLHAQMPG